MKACKLITIVLVGIVIFLWLFQLQKPKPSPVEIHRIDTVTVVKPFEKLVVRRAKPKIIYRRDTIFQTAPFVASLDTILQRDTISLLYQYPENLLDFSISSIPDTYRIPKFVYSLEKRKEKWWEKPVIFVVGTTFGFFLCKIK